MIRTVFRLARTGVVAGLAGCFAAVAGAQELVETPSLEAAGVDGSVPPVAERIPDEPAVVDLASMGRMPGQPGGEIVERPPGVRGFQLLPRRWVVERTFAWLGRCRRLAKDFEGTIESATAWVLVAQIRLLSRRLAKH